MSQLTSRIHRVTSHRVGLMFALLALITGPILPTATPARADHPPENEPHVRLEVYVRQILVLNDTDPAGSGELKFHILARQRAADDSIKEDARMYWGASADSGSFVQVGKVVREGSSDISFGDGVFAMRPGDKLRVWFSAEDDDTYITTIFGTIDDHDDLGAVLGTYEESANWGIGHQVLRNDNYEIQFDIRRAPLPDIQLRNIHAEGPLYEGQPTKVCVDVFEDNGLVEIGDLAAQRSGTFRLNFYVDGVLLEREKYHDLSLSPSESATRCAFATAGPGDHTVVVVADEDHRIEEMNEYNNRITRSLKWSAKPSAIVPGLAELVVHEVRFKGDNAQGTNDCDPGKNDVIATIKNNGTAVADRFIVRLTVDNDDSEERSVDSLDDGRDTTVTFSNVKLEQGTHQIKMMVDAENKVVEHIEANNVFTTSVICQKEDSQ